MENYKNKRKLNQLKKYRLLITVFFLMQIAFIFTLRFTVFVYCPAFIPANMLFFMLLFITLVPYSFFYYSCFYKVQPEILKNQQTDKVAPADIENRDIEKSIEKRDLKKIKDILFETHEAKVAFEKLFSLLSKEYEMGRGVAFVCAPGTTRFEVIATYAFPKDNVPEAFEMGEGISGQAALSGHYVNISDIPQGYLEIGSGLGHAMPTQILIFPVKAENTSIAVIELSFLKTLNSSDVLQLNNFISTIAAQVIKLICNIPLNQCTK